MAKVKSNGPQLKRFLRKECKMSIFHKLKKNRKLRWQNRKNCKKSHKNTKRRWWALSTKKVNPKEGLKPNVSRSKETTHPIRWCHPIFPKTGASCPSSIPIILSHHNCNSLRLFWLSKNHRKPRISMCNQSHSQIKAKFQKVHVDTKAVKR